MLFCGGVVLVTPEMLTTNLSGFVDAPSHLLASPGIAYVTHAAIHLAKSHTDFQ